MSRVCLRLVSLAAGLILIGAALPAGADVSGEVVVMNGDGSGAVAVTRGGPNKYELAWSPDGKSIAFNAWEGSAENANTNLWVMAADGSGLRRLVDDPQHEDGPIWSPDGTEVAFQRRSDTDTDVYAVAVATGQVRPVAGVTGTHAVLSPDWTRIAYSRNDGLYVVENGVERELVTSGGILTAEAWSPDGQQLAYTVLELQGDNLNTDIWIVNADGSDARQVTTDPGFDGEPAWSPDGQLLVYYTTSGDHAQLFTIRVDGTGATNLSNRPHDEANPAWSPTGQIAFVRH